MPIDEQKIILNLKNNLEHKPITASDLPGVNRIGLLPDDTLHFEYDPIKVYGKRPDMIDNTVGIPTKGLDKTLNTIGALTSAVMALPILAYGAEVMPAASPAVIPWLAKNVALPIMGGEVVNRITRKMTGGRYKDFGDWVYRSTPLDDWTKGTWLETPTKFVADGANPGYWAPYSKITKGVGTLIGGVRSSFYKKPSTPGINVVHDITPKDVKYVANPNGKSAMEISDAQTFGNFKAKQFAKDHYGVNLSDEQINNVMLQNIDNISHYTDDLVEISPQIQNKLFENGILKTPDFSGAEHLVYLDKDIVYKVSENASENVIRKSIAQQLSHNSLGRYGAPVKLEGILRDGTKVRAVYSQPKVELSKWRHFGDIGDWILHKKLQQIGYKKANLGGTSGQAMITPSGHIVDDLRGRNMGYLNGNLVLFDPYHVIHTSNIPTSATSINESIVNSGKSMFRDTPANQVQWYHPNPFLKHGGKLWNNS